MSIQPVILCGGSGTRLWPLSRKDRPKPFLPLISNETLFEQAVSRVSVQTGFAPPLVVAGAAHADLIEAHLAGADDARLIIEPEAKNTAPAIALAAALLPPDGVMMVCPSDHYITEPTAFRNAAMTAATLAEQDYLVAFSITPTRPETGNGYLEKRKSAERRLCYSAFCREARSCPRSGLFRERSI